MLIMMMLIIISLLTLPNVRNLDITPQLKSSKDAGTIHPTALSATTIM